MNGEAPLSPQRTLGLGGLLIELVLPVTLAATVLLVMAGYVRYWNLRTPVGVGIFGLLLVALSLSLSLRLDAFTLARRRERGKGQLLNRVGARSRLVKFILGGVVIPIAALATANLLELRDHQTPMSLVIQSRLLTPQASGAEQIGNAVRRARNPAVRVQGILALQALGSEEALDQLIRILKDPEALRGESEYQALSKALASYGVRAKTRLLQLFEQVSPVTSRGAGAPPGDLFERYFSADFEGLTSEIADRSAGTVQTAGPERLKAAKAELKHALDEIGTDMKPAEGSSRVPALVLGTFLQMDLKPDPDLLAFGRRTAADPAWSDGVRGQALLLIAKAGGKDDLEGLYAYLESPSPELQARALQAIAALRSRLSAPGASG